MVGIGEKEVDTFEGKIDEINVSKTILFFDEIHDKEYLFLVANKLKIF